MAAQGQINIRPFLHREMIALSPEGATVCRVCESNLISADEAEPGSAYVALFCNHQGCRNAFRNAGEFNDAEEMNRVLLEWATAERVRLGDGGNANAPRPA